MNNKEHLRTRKQGGWERLSTWAAGAAMRMAIRETRLFSFFFWQCKKENPSDKTCSRNR